jgi:hypothetical protein
MTEEQYAQMARIVDDARMLYKSDTGIVAPQAALQRVCQHDHTFSATWTTDVMHSAEAKLILDLSEDFGDLLAEMGERRRVVLAAA